MRILVDYEGVPGNYTGVPRAIHDDALSLLSAGFYVTLWMNKRTSALVEPFELCNEKENYDLRRLSIDFTRPSNSSLWVTQGFEREIYKRHDVTLTSLFPAIGMPNRRLIRMHDPVGHTGKILREFFLFDGRMKLILARGLRNAAYIRNIKESITIPSSDFISSKLNSIYSSKGVRIHKIPCAVGSGTLEDNYKPSKRENYFLIIGGLRQRKRPDITINTWAENYKSLKVNLIVVGDIPNTALTPKALELRSKGILKLVSQIHTSRLRELQKNALVCIFVSEGEGFGRPIAESLLVGTPVICNDLQVFEEFTHNNVRKFSLDHPQELLNLMYSYVLPISNEERLDILKYGKTFSYESVGEKWRDLILNLELQKPNNSRNF
jgi:glycosyltransferase involved in cell wall biosynthesis